MILRNEPIFASSDPAWVRTVQGLSIDPRQKRALIRFAEGGLSNGEYQEMNGVDRDQSYRELQQLVEMGLLAPSGQGKGMRYHVVRRRSVVGSIGAVVGVSAITSAATTASASGAVGDTPAAGGLPHVLRARMAEVGFITNSDYREAYAVTRRQAKSALGRWLDDGILAVEGRGRSARYVPGPNWPPSGGDSGASDNGPGNGPNGPNNGPNGPGQENV